MSDPYFYGQNRSWAKCDNEGTCAVQFWWYPEGQYLVLDTDYDTYALVYSCSPLDMQYFYILGREPTMDQALIDSLNEQGRQRLPNYDWSLATLDVQGEGCLYES